MRNVARAARRSRPGLGAIRWKAVAGVGLCLGLTAGVVGCGGDKATKPWQSVALEGRVVSSTGLPISGARIAIFYDLPGFSGMLARARSGSEPAGADSVSPPPPSNLPLTNSPNPLVTSTRLYFGLEADAQVGLTILDHDNAPVRTLVAQTLVAGLHAVNWDARNDAGRLVPAGVYIARLVTGSGASAATQRIRMFRLTVNEDEVTEAYIATSGPDGRFAVPMSDLPVGEVVPIRDASGVELGSETVLSTMTVFARTGQGNAEARVDVGDMKGSVPVVLRLGS